MHFQYDNPFRIMNPHKNRVKASFDHNIIPQTFTEGELVLQNDVDQEVVGPRKFETLWKGSYIIKHFILKGEYILTEPDETCLKYPINGLYLKENSSIK